MNEIIQQIKAHARQAQIQPQFAKDQAREIEQLAEALQARANERIEALREALAEQVEACFCPDCEMCFRHEQLLKEAGQ